MSRNDHALLKNILNGMDALICVCNADNFEILFLNDAIKENFNLAKDQDYVGQFCYKVLQKRDSYCPSCPHFELQENPSETIAWEHHETQGKILRKTAKFIEWENGIKGHLEYAIDVTELRQSEETILQLEKELDKIFYDPLTEIYSRRYFEENIEQILQSLSRSSGTLSLMMIDVDNFKLYNDTYGHIKGDECLKAVVQTIKNCLGRREDFIARYGGEEFVIVLPNVNEKGALYLAEKIIKSVRNLKMEHAHNGEYPYVTVSLGLVIGQPETCHLRKDYLETADSLLYDAKKQGRNRYCYSKVSTSR